MMKKIGAHVTVGLLFIVFGMVSVARFSYAVNPTNPSDQNTQTQPPAAGGFTVKIANPLGDKTIDSLPALIALILDVTVKILSPIIVLVIIWTGFRYIKAQGNAAEISKVHDALLWVLIGAAVILGAKVIALALEGTISQL